MCGIVLNFDDDKIEEQAKILDDDCLSRGLLVRMLGTGTMVLSPALVITESEIDTLVGVLKTSFEHITEQLGMDFE
jgi:adenosylmethionine-8-amino-7-oxononanoate aminotransferase